MHKNHSTICDDEFILLEFRSLWENSIKKMFEILTKLTTVTTGKKSDQNVSLFCCVVLFDDWYRCNETSSNTIIECNKRGTVAETLLPSLYVTWLIIAVANEYARSHRTNIHSELDAANEARRCRCRCSRPAHSHSHKSIQIHAHCIASASCEMIRDRFPFAVPIRSTASDASEVNTEKQWIIFVRGVERGTLHCKGVGYRLPFSSNAHWHTHTQHVDVEFNQNRRTPIRSVAVIATLSAVYPNTVAPTARHFSAWSLRRCGYILRTETHTHTERERAIKSSSRCDSAKQFQ